ncbi:MAG: sigma-54-dependent Fis family transcriptional regulator [Bacteroidales bacterium]|nr:sigma-54-dependent Fis family transcriptional regulator [Bacteroidales bacterium]
MQNMDLDQIKQRFGIIGDDPGLDRALEIAQQVAPTDLSVLITGESGVGKEVIPQIIHANSPRKHGVYIAVNCGAIPEGTIDSELFGHEKGSFTGATETRKGYFEEANGGTLFLDEVAELPLSTQVRLLRVLQTGEFIKVGSSKVQKTDVRVIAATNVNLMRAIQTGRFREDLYYRLNTVPISVPPLRERKDDIYRLFRKFALDFSDRYMMPVIRLTPDARTMLESYRWPGNVRQLKSVAEQVSILEHEREIGPDTLIKYLPDTSASLPVKLSDTRTDADYAAERDLIFKILFKLRQDVDELKSGIVTSPSGEQLPPVLEAPSSSIIIDPKDVKSVKEEVEQLQDEVHALENVSIHDVNSELIKRALAKHGGRRKDAAQDLGISERTLYRKIKELGL